MLIAGAGMFGVFLFLTYYLQDTWASARSHRLAFLPMVGGDHRQRHLATIGLLPRIGRRWLVAPGMCGRGRMAWLTRIGVHSSYAADVLPPLWSSASASAS